MKGVIAHWALATVVVAGTVALAPAPAAAGCKMNVHVKNTGSHRIEIINDSNDTAVKNQGGTWRKLRSGGWMDGSDRIQLMPGEQKGDEYAADFACGKKRRFRVNYLCMGDVAFQQFTDYYPSASSWSTQQTVYINLKQCK